jgi:coniferyl-aldehyde dehydrogenase
MPESLAEIIARQRAAFDRDGVPSVDARRRDLLKLKRMLLDHATEIAEAISSDFGHRSHQETMLGDLFPTVAGIDHLHAHVARWARPERRGVVWYFLPARARVVFQPLGVVGIIAPWNYPLFLAFPPMAAAIAAGNRVMLKPSEFNPATSALLEKLLGEIFPIEQVAVATGGAEVGAAFSRLPFDHLFFTGSTPVGRKVMQAASEHLVPVTLELGGKSPAIVERGFPIDRAAWGIATGKLFNAGQTCIAPDYALIPEEAVESFVSAVTVAMRRLYPTIAGNPDYTSIINDGHFTRLNGLVADARAKGARVVEVGTGDGRTLPPTLLTGVNDEMKVMQEEIFGPLLPIVPYRDLDDAIRYVNAHPRPLSLYLFGHDGPGRRAVLSRTTSGGVTINDTLLHVVQENLPFGGVGPSGMGHYHGHEGFRTFSHAKAVFSQSRISAISLLRPPYGARFDRMMRFLLG